MLDRKIMIPLLIFAGGAFAGELAESVDYRRPDAPRALLERDILCSGPQTLLVSLKKSAPAAYRRELAERSIGDAVWMQAAAQIQLSADRALMGDLAASPQVLHIFRPSPLPAADTAELVRQAEAGPVSVILSLAVDLPTGLSDQDRQNR